EGEQWERAEIRDEFIVKFRRPSPAVGFLAPVGVVHRAWGDRRVDGRSHCIPPADVRHPVIGSTLPNGLPHFLTLDKTVVLTPQQHVTEVAEKPSVRHDPMLTGRPASEVSRLRGAGD